MMNLLGVICALRERKILTTDPYLAANTNPERLTRVVLIPTQTLIDASDPIFCLCAAGLALAKPLDLTDGIFDAFDR